jgi:uncharacterized tellurite resistance protein B-like protein
MEQEEKLLKDYSDSEKGAYIAAIASIATADRTASEDELEFLDAIGDAAELSPEQKMQVKNAALDDSGSDLKPQLEILKNSELKYSLITDLIAFAESDREYSPEERDSVERIAWFLDIKPEQFSTINQFVQKAATAEETPQEQGLFGMEDKFQKAGLNLGSITKGLIGIVGPMILSGLVSRGLGRKGGGGLLGGMTGGGLGGMLGGSGGLGNMLGGGGLGSIIGMLNGGRGMKSTGGLLGRVLGGGF